MTFGEKVRTLRKKRGLTAEELGRLTGLTQQAISAYENEVSKKPLPVAKLALASALKVKPSELDDDREEDHNGNPENPG